MTLSAPDINSPAPAEMGPFLEVQDLRVHFPTDDGLVKSVDGLELRPRARPDPRHRRRVRVGQVGDEHGGDGSAREVGPDQRFDPRRRRGAGRQLGGARPPPARQEDGDDLPGPAVLDAPLLHRGEPDHRGLHDPQQGLQEAGARARDRHARPGRHPRALAAHRRLPAPVLRWHAPARDDRDGALLRPRPADRRRADHGARRDGAGADPRPDPRPAAGVQLRGRDHHPRPRRRGRAGRRHPGDVRRPGRRVRHRRSSCSTAPSTPTPGASWARCRASTSRRPSGCCRSRARRPA